MTQKQVGGSKIRNSVATLLYMSFFNLVLTVSLTCYSSEHCQNMVLCLKCFIRPNVFMHVYDVLFLFSGLCNCLYLLCIDFMVCQPIALELIWSNCLSGKILFIVFYCDINMWQCCAMFCYLHHSIH